MGQLLLFLPGFVNARALRVLSDKKSRGLFLFRGINKQERQGIASKSKADLEFSCSMHPGERTGLVWEAGGLSWQYALLL